MSKYSYFSWHDIKDLAQIYNEDEWDNAHISVWDPAYQRSYDLCFTGSSKMENEPNNIYFTVTRTNENIADDEKEINEYFEKSYANLLQYQPDINKTLLQKIFMQGVELGRQLHTK